MAKIDDLLNMLGGISALAGEAHTEYHDAADALATADAEIARLNALIDDLTPEMALVAGMLTRSGVPPPVYDGWNPEIPAARVMPSKGVYDFTAIHDALTRNPNARLRLLHGVSDPDWLKTASGGPVLVENFQDHKTGTVAHYWAGAYMDVEDQLQDALATEFDGTLRATFITTAMLIYAEPFQRQLMSTITKTNLLAAGWTPALDAAALYRMTTCHRAWKKTRVGVAMNPYQTLDGAGTVKVDLDETQRWMEDFRSTFPNGILSNNSIRESMIGDESKAGNFYQRLMAMGKPLSFQTAIWDRIAKEAGAATTARKLDALKRTIEWAISMKAHALEVPGGHTLTDADIRAFSVRLKANAA